MVCCILLLHIRKETRPMVVKYRSISHNVKFMSYWDTPIILKSCIPTSILEICRIKEYLCHIDKNASKTQTMATHHHHSNITPFASFEKASRVSS